MPGDNDGNVFFVNNILTEINLIGFTTQCGKIKGTHIANTISQKLTPVSRKTIE